jgi:two-component system NtrC family sensor kinase
VSASLDTVPYESAPQSVDSRLLHAALDASDQNILVTDRSGHIQFANRALASMHGHLREELIGQHVSVVLPVEPNRPQIEKMRRAFRDSQPVRVVVQGHRQGGSALWLSLAITPVVDVQGKAILFVGIATDITQSVEDARVRRELQARIESQEEERERLTRELRLAQKLEAVGRLAAGVGHEINTPMQFVSDNISFLRDSVGDLAKVIEAYKRGPEDGDAVAEDADLDYLLTELPKSMDRATEGVTRVAGIVRALKEFSHPGAQARSSSDLNRALENTLQLARGEYKLFAIVEKRFGALPLVICNVGELSQVFVNLLVNAAHAIEATGKDPSTGRITVTTEAIGAEVSITIEDNGCGIPAEHLEKIFDPFFTTKEIGKGTGQGLAIARSIIIDRHGGSLDVDSVVGRGTRMTMRLPAAGNG